MKYQLIILDKNTWKLTIEPEDSELKKLFYRMMKDIDSIKPAASLRVLGVLSCYGGVERVEFLVRKEGERDE